MEVCNAGSRECVTEAQMELVNITIQSRLNSMNLVKNNDSESLGEAFKVFARCQCLPACVSIEYDAETSQADYDWQAIFRVYKLNTTEDLEGSSYSRVMVFFKEAQFLASRRSELYGKMDFFANCGGLLGLFMGFSILSVIEIIYFLTLRLWCVLYRRQKRNELKRASIAEGSLYKGKLVD